MARSSNVSITVNITIGLLLLLTIGWNSTSKQVQPIHVARAEGEIGGEFLCTNQCGETVSGVYHMDNVDQIKNGSLQHQSHIRSISTSTCARPYVDLMMQQRESWNKDIVLFKHGDARHITNTQDTTLSRAKITITSIQNSSRHGKLHDQTYKEHRADGNHQDLYSPVKLFLVAQVVNDPSSVYYHQLHTVTIFLSGKTALKMCEINRHAVEVPGIQISLQYACGC